MLTDWRTPDAGQLIEFAHRCWAEDEREMHYAACDQLRRHADRLEQGHLADLEHLIVAKPWWDTCDVLATRLCPEEAEDMRAGRLSAAAFATGGSWHWQMANKEKSAPPRSMPVQGG